MSIRNIISRLYIIHISAIITVWLATYFPGLDMVMALLYLALLIMEARSRPYIRRWHRFKIVLAWQGPALLLSLASAVSMGAWGQANYAYFILEFWATPVLPLISLTAGPVWMGFPVYYYVILLMPFVLAGYYSLFLSGKRI